jgi:hypothetical protein
VIGNCDARAAADVACGHKAAARLRQAGKIAALHKKLDVTYNLNAAWKELG